LSEEEAFDDEPVDSREIPFPIEFLKLPNFLNVEKMLFFFGDVG
jgi:hypothetical protein